MLVKELAKNERPREKALKFGIKILSNRELLALLIRCGYVNYSALDISDSLFKEQHSLSRLLNMEFSELIKYKGIKEAKALEILACVELAKRMMLEKAEEVDLIASPRHLIDWLHLKFGHIEQEEFIVVFLNTKNHIVYHEVISKGGLDSTTVHPREVYKKAIKLACAKIICVHNHPSGDITPSPADVKVTKRLIEAGGVLGIELLDHIIVAGNDHYSFRDNNLLNP